MGICSMIALGVLLVSFSGMARGCSPTGEPEPTVEQQIREGHVVVYGKVLREVEDPHLSFGGGMKVYTAQMLVYCSLKQYRGQEIPALINITEAGTIPGLCYRTEYKTGTEYIAILRVDHDNKLKPWQGPHSSINVEEDAADVDLVLSSCELHPDTPDIPREMQSNMAPPRKECLRTTCPVDDHDHGDGHYHGDGHADHDHGDHDHGDGHYHGDGHADHDHGDHDHGDGHYHGDGHADHDHGDHDHGDGHYHGDGHADHDHGDHDHGDGHYHGDGHDYHDHGDHDHGDGHYHGDGHDYHDHGGDVAPVVGGSSGSIVNKSSTFLVTFLLCSSVFLLL